MPEISFNNHSNLGELNSRKKFPKSFNVIDKAIVCAAEFPMSMTSNQYSTKASFFPFIVLVVLILIEMCEALPCLSLPIPCPWLVEQVWAEAHQILIVPRLASPSRLQPPLAHIAWIFRTVAYTCTVDFTKCHT